MEALSRLATHEAGNGAQSRESCAASPHPKERPRRQGAGPGWKFRGNASSLLLHLVRVNLVTRLAVLRLSHSSAGAIRYRSSSLSLASE